MRLLYSAEIEQAILGAAMIDPNLVDDLINKADSSYFFTPPASKVFQAILQSQGGAVDAVSIGDLSGEFEFCVDACQNVPSTHLFTSWLQKLADYAKERELYKVGQLINEELLHNEEAKTSERVQAIEAAFTALSTERIPSTVFTLKDAVKELVAHLEWKNDNPNHQGILSGMKDYDERIGGYNGGEMIVIAGTPGSGKTTFGMQIVRESCTNGKRAMVFSLEMPKVQLAQRMIAASHTIPLNAFKDNSVYQNPEHSVKLGPAIVHSAKMDMVIDDQGGLDILDLKTRARIAHREKKLDVILIDYLQLLNDKRHKDRFQVVSSVSREIKALSKELNCPVIALSQLNRAIMNRTDKRPQLSDLRESGQIEQDADVITFLFRESLFNEDCQNQNAVEIITRKFRDGETGVDYAEFQGQYNRFINTQWKPDPIQNNSGGWGG